jgi:FMN phosphatase YigB (HAD superfamily)
MRVVVVDLDGTLCNAKHREHLAQSGLWDDFHALLVEDEPNSDVKEFCEIYGFKWDVQIVFCTGRNDRWRNETLNWLSKHRIYADDLLMRPDGNYDSDTVIKPKMLCQWLADNCLKESDVMVILEDRDKMVDCWRNLGFNCWQVRASGY